MRLSVVLLVSLVVVVAEAARFNKEYSSYPRVPNGNGRWGSGSSSLGSHDLTSQDTHRSVSLKSIGAALKPFQSYFGAGIVILAILRLVQDRGLLGPNFVLPAWLGRAPKLPSEEGSTKELKSDQEEIWNAILNVHNIQKVTKQETEANAAAILELRAEQESLAQENKVKLDAIVTRLDEIDQSLLELNNAVSDLTQSVDTRELQKGLHAVEDRVERESRATSASVKQIREELPEMMQRHDAMVTEKLIKFKEDLKRILSNNKPATTSSTKNTSCSGSNNAKTNGKDKYKSKNK